MGFSGPPSGGYCGSLFARHRLFGSSGYMGSILSDRVPCCRTSYSFTGGKVPGLPRCRHHQRLFKPIQSQAGHPSHMWISPLRKHYGESHSARHPFEVVEFPSLQCRLLHSGISPTSQKMACSSFGRRGGSGSVNSYSQRSRAQKRCEGTALGPCREEDGATSCRTTLSWTRTPPCSCGTPSCRRPRTVGAIRRSRTSQTRRPRHANYGPGWTLSVPGWYLEQCRQQEVESQSQSDSSQRLQSLSRQMYLVVFQ